MKLACSCGQAFVYDHQKAGQQFQCKWCKRMVTVPPFQSLPPDDQATYRDELQKAQSEAERKKQVEAAREQAKLDKEKKRIDKEKARIEANQRKRQTNATGGVLSRLIYFLDLRFERYLTPWIIRRTWVWAICVMCLLLLSHLCLCSYRALPRREVVRQRIPMDVAEKKERLALLIMQKSLVAERPQPRIAPRTASVEPPRDEPRRRTLEQPQKEEDKYASMTLEQLQAEKADLDRRYAETKEEWVWGQWWFYGLAALIGVLSAVLALVSLRVACEFVIVVFNIAMALTAMKERFADLKTASAPAEVAATSDG